MAKFEPGHCYDWILKKYDLKSKYDFLNMIWTIKQSRQDFPGRHLCDGYSMDIMCDAYVCKFNIQN